jgi:CheY-like chemotaxis protein
VSDRPSREGSARPDLLAGWRILVVDDQEDVRSYLLTVLADAGAQICEASDGREALKAARSFKPDLITLDLSMPEHDGIATFCDLRSSPETEAIPVCIVTGHPEMRALIYERPARLPEGFLDKPIDPKGLVSTIRRILDLSRRRGRGS